METMWLTQCNLTGQTACGSYNMSSKPHDCHAVFSGARQRDLSSCFYHISAKYGHTLTIKTLNEMYECRTYGPVLLVLDADANIFAQIHDHMWP